MNFLTSPNIIVLPVAVFVFDTGFHVYVWIGKDASQHEKGGGLAIAHVSTKHNIRYMLITSTGACSAVNR